MFRKIRNMRNLSNFKLSSLPIVMSKMDAQNKLLRLFKPIVKQITVKNHQKLQ